MFKHSIYYFLGYMIRKWKKKLHNVYQEQDLKPTHEEMCKWFIYILEKKTNRYFYTNQESHSFSCNLKLKRRFNLSSLIQCCWTEQDPLRYLMPLIFKINKKSSYEFFPLHSRNIKIWVCLKCGYY